MNLKKQVMTYKYIIYMIIVIFLFSCKEKKTEIFLLEDLVYEWKGSKTEYFVISNPPKNRNELIKLINHYNDSTLTYRQITKYKRYSRLFCKESRKLTRNYKEESGFFGDRIGRHYKNYILLIEWEESPYGKYVQSSFYTKGDVDTTIFNDMSEQNFSSQFNEIDN